MNCKVLCVDDDPNVLKGYQRTLRADMAVDVAVGPEQGLRCVAEQGPYAVVVSDLRMPGMDGIAFLGKVRELAPQSVRVMITGNADLETAIQAVNEGEIFRFLTKPCAPGLLMKTVQLSIEHYRLLVAEKELLEKTLMGSIKVLTEVLSLVNPLAFGRATRVRRLAARLGKKLLPNSWQLEIAALLSQLGCVTVPEQTLSQIFGNKRVPEEEWKIYRSHPQVGRDLIAHIPRLEEIAQIIAYQEKHFDGTGIPVDTVSGKAIPFESRILKVALDYDAFSALNLNSVEVIHELKKHRGRYDPEILEVLETIFENEISHVPRSIRSSDLKVGMILAEDVRTSSGMLLASRGIEVKSSLILRLNNFAHTWGGIQEPLRVLMVAPKQEGKSEADNPAGTAQGASTPDVQSPKGRNQ